MAPPRNVPSHGRCKIELRVLRQALERDLAITLNVDSPRFLPCRASSVSPHVDFAGGLSLSVRSCKPTRPSHNCLWRAEARSKKDKSA